jgi:hypothetical protein
MRASRASENPPPLLIACAPCAASFDRLRGVAGACALALTGANIAAAAEIFNSARRSSFDALGTMRASAS